MKLKYNIKKKHITVTCRSRIFFVANDLLLFTVGKCICNDGYDVQSECRLKKDGKPEVTYVTGDGNCNPRKADCNTVTFVTRDGCSETTVCSRKGKHVTVILVL